jgi:hypothetical protein
MEYTAAQLSILSIGASSVLVLSLLTILSVNQAGAQVTDPDKFSIKSSPYGVPFQKWTQKWWQWYLSVPKENNHNFESTQGYVHKDCSYLQNSSSPVFFVPYVLKEKGQSAVATCTVPQNKAIMLGIDNGLMDYGDPSAQPKTVAKITEMVKKSNEFPNKFDITLDGKPLRLTNEEKDRVTSEPFYIILPDNNIWNESPHKPYLAVADGWYLMLKPLQPGKHVLHYTTGYKIPFAAIGGANQEGYIQDVTYNLVVNGSAK